MADSCVTCGQTNPPPPYLLMSTEADMESFLREYITGLARCNVDRNRIAVLCNGIRDFIHQTRTRQGL